MSVPGPTTTPNIRRHHRTKYSTHKISEIPNKDIRLKDKIKFSTILSNCISILETTHLTSSVLQTKPRINPELAPLSNIHFHL